MSLFLPEHMIWWNCYRISSATQLPTHTSRVCVPVIGEKDLSEKIQVIYRKPKSKFWAMRAFIADPKSIGCSTRWQVGEMVGARVLRGLSKFMICVHFLKHFLFCSYILLSRDGILLRPSVTWIIPRQSQSIRHASAKLVHFYFLFVCDTNNARAASRQYQDATSIWWWEGDCNGNDLLRTTDYVSLE